MANNNQTALMMSIQRKKERVKELYRDIATHPSSRMRNISKGMLRAIQEEIAEDEKLLAVEEERERSIIDETWKHAYEDEQVPSTATQDEIIRVVNEKYGTDGK